MYPGDSTPRVKHQSKFQKGWEVYYSLENKRNLGGEIFFEKEEWKEEDQELGKSYSNLTPKNLLKWSACPNTLYEVFW